MKILFFTKYSGKGASSRYRTFQYLDYLRSHGIEADVFPLLGDEYLERLYAGRRISRRYLFGCFLRRIRDLFRVCKYDVVVVENELLPHVPPVLEHVLRWLNSSVVVDYDDAIFANYQDNPLLKRKIPTVMRLSKAVNAGNQYLADYAREFNSNVALIPTVVNLDNYKPKDSYEISADKVVIGWIGTPITSKYLLEVQGALSRLAQKYPITLRCIGTSPDFAIPNVRLENMKWEESTETDNILAFDIGIMPLSDDPFSRGKCGLKLIQYMACGIPSVASPVGANKAIIQDGVNGLLASPSDEWVDKIALLIEDVQLRERIGRGARRTVANKYSLQVIAPKLLEIYKGVAQEAMKER